MFQCMSTTTLFIDPVKHTQKKKNGKRLSEGESMLPVT